MPTHGPVRRPRPLPLLPHDLRRHRRRRRWSSSVPRLLCLQGHGTFGSGVMQFPNMFMELSQSLVLRLPMAVAFRLLMVSEESTLHLIMMTLEKRLDKFTTEPTDYVTMEMTVSGLMPGQSRLRRTPWYRMLTLEKTLAIFTTEPTDYVKKKLLS
mmetsp:Transcript_7032/g.17607  ORF Transcript_7032/g.17607 Transcript_7032/m.17607 type:complete len:155 (+) Transcript_7032:530-994(+)